MAWVNGPPNGRDYAPAGFVEIDSYTGNWYRKTTPVEYNTGWVLFGDQIRIGDRGEPDTPGDTTIITVVFNTDGSVFVWNPVTETWFEVNPSVPLGIYTPDTVDDLRLIDDDGGLRMALTAGTNTKFDGESRIYKWDPASAAPDDGITTIRPLSQAPGALGAWIEL